MEAITNTVTGSDMPPYLNADLQFLGMKGEGIIDDSVWIFKSHHPFRDKDSPLSSANKAICVVRNPLDAILSFFSLMTTFSQARTIPPEKLKEVKESFEKFA
jgi:hypothetical protein